MHSCQNMLIERPLPFRQPTCRARSKRSTLVFELPVLGPRFCPSLDVRGDQFVWQYELRAHESATLLRVDGCLGTIGSSTRVLELMSVSLQNTRQQNPTCFHISEVEISRAGR